MESLEDAMKKREDELSQLRTKLASLQVSGAQVQWMFTRLAVGETMIDNWWLGDLFEISKKLPSLLSGLDFD